MIYRQKSSSILSSSSAKLMTSICWVALILAFNGSASGQTGDEQVNDAIDEIVVQARKRQEALRNIPVTGAALSEQDIEDLGGFFDPTEIGEFFTGVSVDEEGNAEYFIRGAGVQRNGFTDSATVQLRNGANIAGSFGGRAFQTIDLFDVRQIEVYRGAQGSLYGRNAVGGVINLVNQEPKDYFEYSGLASWDFEREQIRTEAIVNKPVNNRLFMRLGVQYIEEEGLIWNSFRDEPANPRESIGARLGLRALISERTDATLFIDYESFERDSFFNGPRSTLPGELVTTGVGADPDGTPYPPNSLVPFPFASGGEFRNQAFDTPGFQDQRLLNVNLTANTQFDFAVLQSITNVRNRTFDFNADDDSGYIGGPPNVTGGGGTQCRDGGGMGMFAGRDPDDDITNMQCFGEIRSESTIVTQEFRLVSPEDRRLDWLLGADYRYLTNPSSELSLGRSDTGGTAQNSSTNVETNESHAFGLFLSLGFDITNRLTISSSVRYNYERKSFELITSDLDGATPDEIFNKEDSAIFQNVSPSLTLSYTWQDKLLYASWAQAFRSGGFNRAFGPSILGSISVDVPFQFNEETANSYEIGLKGDFGRQLSYAISAFRAEYNNTFDNFIVGIEDDGDPDTDIDFVQVQNIANIGDAYIQGVEIDLSSRVRDFLRSGGNLSARGGLAYAVSKVTGGPTSGEKLGGVPRWAWNGNFTYRRPFPFLENTGLGLFANTNFSWEVARQSSSGEQLDDVRKWDLQLGVEGESYGRAWRLTGFWNNWIGHVYDTSTPNCNQGQSPFTVVAECRRESTDPTFGVRLSLRGGEGDRRRR